MLSLMLVILVLIPLALAIEDTDRDGIPDEQDSFPGDFDNDGMSDEWEMMFGLRFDSATDAQEDLDNDGISNLEEFNQGTDPTLSDVSEPPPELFAPTSFKFSAEMILGTVIIVMIIVIAILVVRVIQKKKKSNPLKPIKESKESLDLPHLHTPSQIHKTLPPLPTRSVPPPIKQPKQSHQVPIQSLNAPIQKRPIPKPVEKPVYQKLDQELDDAFKRLERMKEKFENETRN